MIKYHDQITLHDKEFIWDYSSRWIRVHPGREAWKQVAEMTTGVGS